MYVFVHLEPEGRLTPHAALDNDEGDHQKQMKELIKRTASSIDDLALKMLFVTVQQNNLEVCIQYAVNQ
jgi:hypothetical protein